MDQFYSEVERCDLLRMVDAAANRAREGARVAEDFTRFVLDDVHLTTQLKSLRHELTDSLRQLPAESLLAARDTLVDVGTTMDTTSESQRTSLVDLARTNLKRLQEALRTLEECARRLSPTLETTRGAVPVPATTTIAAQLGKLRYRAYTLEKAILLTHRSRQRLSDRRLYLLVSSDCGRERLERIVTESVSGGVKIVQLREKSISDRDLFHLALQMREWTRRVDCLLIVNDRPDIALFCDADGVHVGQDDVSVRAARRIVGPDRLVGVSTHSIEQARHAVLEGADYIGVGPVFPSRTKQFESFAGLELVHQVANEITLPWFAIGGIDTTNLARVIKEGAQRVAVSSAICHAEDPGRAASELAQQIGTSGSG